MDKIFLEVLRVSVLAGGMTLAVLVIRFLFRKAPKSLYCLLWMLVGVRLVFPFSIESVFGLFPQQEMLEARIFGDGTEGIGENTGLEQVLSGEATPGRSPAGPGQAGDITRSGDAGDKITARERWQRILYISSWIWFAGMLLMCACFVYNWIKIKACVRGSEQEVYLLESEGAEKEVRLFRCGNIETPFLFGILHPEIYIPFHMDEEDLLYIVQHELTHRRRRDHLVKPAAFFLLAVHWFNPCIWIAYKMLCRDMELACDEMVIRDMKVKDRKAYSRALLNCSVWQEKAAVYPVAFGELSVKERIKNILNYRKPTVLAVSLGIVLCAVLLFCFMTQKKAGNGRTILLTNEAGRSNEEEAGVSGSGADGPGDVDSRRTVQERELQQAAGQMEDLRKMQRDQETAIANIQDERRSLAHVEAWADAFCDRNGKALVSLCSEELLEAFREEDAIINIEGEEPGFGWSSPWPWDKEADYRIMSLTNTTARVLYYAWTSDPHVTVWEENLTWHEEGGVYMMDSSKLTVRDNLCTGEEFYSAYPEGIISGTRMDYLSNGTEGALNENAKANRDFYEPLFAPDTAARFLLNLLDNNEKVRVAVEEEEEGKAQVSIEFILDHVQVHVTMLRPYGEDGIWIPQTQEG